MKFCFLVSQALHNFALLHVLKSILVGEEGKSLPDIEFSPNLQEDS